MYGTLVVNSWVGIHEGCDITYSVNGSDGVYVVVSGKAMPFEFFFDCEALREFLAQGGKALAEMDVMAEREATEWESRQQAGSGQAAERPA